MSTPIDIIANAIRESCGGQPPVGLAGPLAEVAARSLTQDAVIIHAARALAADTAGRPNSPLHAANMTIAAYEHLARVVLRSVGGV